MDPSNNLLGNYDHIHCITAQNRGDCVLETRNRLKIRSLMGISKFFTLKIWGPVPLTIVIPSSSLTWISKSKGQVLYALSISYSSAVHSPINTLDCARLYLQWRCDSSLPPCVGELSVVAITVIPVFITLTISLNIQTGRRGPLDTHCTDAIPPLLFTTPCTEPAMVMPSQKANTLYVPSNADRPQYGFSLLASVLQTSTQYSRMN